MSEPLRITYLRHSGFAVETGGALLVFDDAESEQSREGGIAQGHVDRALLERYESVIFFVSHSHDDHYNEAIFSFSDLPKVRYVLGFPAPAGREACSMRKGDDLSLLAWTLRPTVRRTRACRSWCARAAGRSSMRAI